MTRDGSGKTITSFKTALFLSPKKGIVVTTTFKLNNLVNDLVGSQDYGISEKRLIFIREFNKDNKYKLADIKNIFLLPNDLQGKIIEKIGIHKFSNLENSMGNIYLYQVDYDILVDAYMFKDKEIGKEILEGIEEGVEQYIRKANS